MNESSSMESPSFLAQLQARLVAVAVEAVPAPAPKRRRQPKVPAPATSAQSSPGTPQPILFKLAEPLQTQMEQPPLSSTPIIESVVPPISPPGEQPRPLVPVASYVSEETILSQKSKSRVLVLDSATVAGYRQVLEAARYQEFYKAMQAVRTGL